jgi:DnaJ-like protein
MSEIDDYLKRLGLERGVDVTTVKRTYRKLVKSLHPDARDGGNLEEFRLVTAAYEYAMSHPSELEKVKPGRYAVWTDTYPEANATPKWTPSSQVSPPVLFEYRLPPNLDHYDVTIPTYDDKFPYDSVLVIDIGKTYRIPIKRDTPIPITLKGKMSGRPVTIRVTSMSDDAWLAARPGPKARRNS